MARYRKSINRDLFYALRPDLVTELAFALVSKLQKRPEHVVAGTAMLFTIACRTFKVKPHEALDACARMLRDAVGKDRGHYEAITNYLLEEVPHNDKVAYHNDKRPDYSGTFDPYEKY